ncbi:MAG TPA: hypothetical protein DDY22_18195 [Geobacter sp.]|nr:hypothetical protein [Geobacter sp.]
MQVKLTLSLEKDVIEHAKEFSRRQHKSLSKLVENYLRQITANASDKEAITPLVSDLSGVIKPDAAEKRKADYTDYLAEKYR